MLSRSISRSRSRLPFKKQSVEESIYRERSQERSNEKYHKSELYRKEKPTIQDVPLLNSSFNNRINLPQFQQEQNERGRSRDRGNSSPTKSNSSTNQTVDSSLEEDDPDMISLMGFSGFGTTKGKHVKGSKGGAAKTEKKTEYRQYMNRTKGFNRPLSPSRDK